VPGIRLGRLAADARLELGQVVEEVVGHPPDRLVRRVDPRGFFPLDADLERLAVPARPGRGQLEHIVHHAGDDVSGVPVVHGRRGICHSAHDAEAHRHSGRRVLPLGERPR